MILGNNIKPTINTSLSILPPIREESILTDITESTKPFIIDNIIDNTISNDNIYKMEDLDQIVNTVNTVNTNNVLKKGNKYCCICM